MEKFTNRFLKQFLVSLIVFLTYGLFVSLSPPAYAQEPADPPAESAWFAPSLQEFGQTLDGSQSDQSVNKEAYDTATQINQMSAMTCMILGCSENPASINYYGKSAIANSGNYIAMIYTNPPANFGYWLADTGRSLGFLPKQAYAQGIGFSGLSTLLPIWKAFRNIAYMLLAVVMIIIGFMVMFRKKIDPKTVVTVQSALPKIVITLLLITFSYAIVGIMIDLMYLVILLGIAILVPAGNQLGLTNFAGVPNPLGADTASKYLTGGIGTLFWSILGGSMSSFDNLLRMFMGNFPHSIGGLITGGLKLLAVSAGGGAILIFILGIIALFLFIRILFLLVGAYIQIIVSLIFAPLQLLTEAIPGSSGFASWFKNLIANLAVFPITAILLLIGTILTRTSSENLWVPPLLGGNTSRDGMAALIGLGVLGIIPNMAGALKEAMKSKPAIPAGPGAILGPAGAGAGQIMQLVYQVSAISGAIGGHGKPKPGDLEEMRRAGGGR